MQIPKSQISTTPDRMCFLLYKEKTNPVSLQQFAAATSIGWLLLFQDSCRSTVSKRLSSCAIPGYAARYFPLVGMGKTRNIGMKYIWRCGPTHTLVLAFSFLPSHTLVLPAIGDLRHWRLPDLDAPQHSMSQPEPDPPRPRSNFLLCCSSSDLQGRPPIRITKGMNRSRSGFHAQAAFSGKALKQYISFPLSFWTLLLSLIEPHLLFQVMHLLGIVLYSTTMIAS